MSALLLNDVFISVLIDMVGKVRLILARERV